MFKRGVFFFAVFVPFFGLNWLNSPLAIAQSTQEPASPDTGTPQGQQGVGGTRPQTSCPDTGNKRLMALVQARGEDITRVENPTIWVYIPYSSEQIGYLEFSLHDRPLTQTFYRTAIELADRPGLIKIPIPYKLTPNLTYRWYIKLYCQPHKPGENTKYSHLQNWIQYRPDFPVENSWYDRIDDVGNRYFSSPQNDTFKQDWEELLKLLSLPEWLGQEPLVDASFVMSH